MDPDGSGGSPATTTWYVWDGDRLLGEYADVSGSRRVRYAYAGGLAPVQVAYDNGSGGEDVFDVHTDHLDTPRLLTDATGAGAWQSSHEAYGAAVITSSLGAGRSFNIRFPGQYHDEETGIHYNRFRYYDPEIGRYVSADPIGQFGAVNTYGYALQNPTFGADQLGLNPLLYFAVAVGGACVATYAATSLDAAADAADVLAARNQAQAQIDSLLAERIGETSGHSRTDKLRSVKFLRGHH